VDEKGWLKNGSMVEKCWLKNNIREFHSGWKRGYWKMVDEKRL